MRDLLQFTIQVSIEQDGRELLLLWLWIIVRTGGGAEVRHRPRKTRRYCGSFERRRSPFVVAIVRTIGHEKLVDHYCGFFERCSPFVVAIANRHHELEWLIVNRHHAACVSGWHSSIGEPFWID